MAEQHFDLAQTGGYFEKRLGRVRSRRMKVFFRERELELEK